MADRAGRPLSRWALAAGLGVVVVVLWMVPLSSLHVVGGRAHPIQLSGDDRAGTGEWLLMSATVRRWTIGEWLWARYGPGDGPRPVEVAAGGAEQAAGGGPTAMATSKSRAWRTALDLAGPALAVQHVRPATPAARAGLAPGDIVLRVDGGPPTTRAIDTALATGRTVALRVLSGGRVVALTLRPAPPWPQPIGGGATYALLVATGPEPQAPALDTGDVSGESAGLVLALAYLDLLDEGDLTGGRVIAATGALGPGGTLFGVLAYGAKARAAARAGATVMLVPAADAAVVRSVAPEGLEVHGVAGVGDAVRLLCRMGGTSSACRA